MLTEIHKNSHATLEQGEFSHQFFPELPFKKHVSLCFPRLPHCHGPLTLLGVCFLCIVRRVVCGSVLQCVAACCSVYIYTANCFGVCLLFTVR